MQNELKYEQTRFLEDELDVKLISVAQDLSFSTPKYKLDNFVVHRLHHMPKSNNGLWN
jgi:hypothetical protein